MEKNEWSGEGGGLVCAAFSAGTENIWSGAGVQVDHKAACKQDGSDVGAPPEQFSHHSRPLKTSRLEMISV